MDNKEPQFLEKNTILAIVLVGISFFGWQMYLQKKYPNSGKQLPQSLSETEKTSEKIKDVPAGAIQANGSSAGGADSAATVEAALNDKIQTLTVENDLFKAEVSSLGMGLSSIKLKTYRNEKGEPYSFSDSEGNRLFDLRLVGDSKPLNFEIKKIDDETVVGEALRGAIRISRTIKFHAHNGKMENSLKIENAPADFQGFLIALPEENRAPEHGGFLSGPARPHEFVFTTDGKTRRHSLASTSPDEALAKKPNVTMAGFSHSYFASALVDSSETIPQVEFSELNKEMVLAQLVYKPATIKPELNFSWINFAGGKSLKDLESSHPEFAPLVDFGFFGAIGKVLLKVLIEIHQRVGNWGWAIVLLTLAVRALVLPFNLLAYRSMKKMQAIQPALQSIRAKYKDDPVAMNRETMAVMSKEKVSPLGGCLPMLLQMPIFFAFYQVLGQSIELYQAPFTLWIHDLSIKDPVFVLPVLMALTMFIQQKLTPTTMDPTQAKIMQWMPVVFAVFMVNLPSGLTLYMFVSTLFAVIQQRIFMGQPAKAPARAAILDVKPILGD